MAAMQMENFLKLLLFSVKDQLKIKNKNITRKKDSSSSRAFI